MSQPNTLPKTDKHADPSDGLDQGALELAVLYAKELTKVRDSKGSKSARDIGTEAESNWRGLITKKDNLPSGWALLYNKSTGVRPCAEEGTLRGSRLFDAIFEQGPFVIGFEVQASDYKREDSKGKTKPVGHKPVQEQAQRLWVEQVIAPRPAVAYKVVCDESSSPELLKFTQSRPTVRRLSSALQSRLRNT